MEDKTMQYFIVTYQNGEQKRVNVKGSLMDALTEQRKWVLKAKKDRNIIEVGKIHLEH